MTQNDAVKRHICSFCNYSTNRFFDLKRHQNAKHKKQIGKDNEDIAGAENVIPNCENVIPNGENVIPNLQNVIPILQNVLSDEKVSDTHKFSCWKCDKMYKTEKYMKNHIISCKGIDELTCPRCMKLFSNRHNKSRHIKANKCKARSIIHAKNQQKVIQNIQNITNNIQNIETQNNIINKNNIIINNFGSERIDHITYDDIINMLKEGENTIPKYIEKKHFDKDFPENHNIIYTKQNKCHVFEKDAWKIRNLSSISSKLVKDNSGALLLFCNDNEIRLVHDFQNEDIFNFVKDNLMKIYHKDDEKYKEIYNMVKEIIVNTQ